MGRNMFLRLWKFLCWRDLDLGLFLRKWCVLIFLDLIQSNFTNCIMLSNFFGLRPFISNLEGKTDQIEETRWRTSPMILVRARSTL